MTHPVSPLPLQPQMVTGVLRPPNSQTMCHSSAGGNPRGFSEGHASSWLRNPPSLAQCWLSTPLAPHALVIPARAVICHRNLGREHLSMQ
jgi:hypothetical protein